MLALWLMLPPTISTLFMSILIYCLQQCFIIRLKYHNTLVLNFFSFSLSIYFVFHFNKQCVEIVIHDLINYKQIDEISHEVASTAFSSSSLTSLIVLTTGFSNDDFSFCMTFMMTMMIMMMPILIFVALLLMQLIFGYCCWLWFSLIFYWWWWQWCSLYFS